MMNDIQTFVPHWSGVAFTIHRYIEPFDGSSIHGLDIFHVLFKNKTANESENTMY